MKKLFTTILALGLLWCSNSFSQNCDPNQYNDGMMVKEYEAEYNYKAEEAYSFGKKIQNILLKKDLRGFIDLTIGDLRTSLEQKYTENKSFKNFFDDEQYKKIVDGEVYCFPLGSIETLQFKLGDDWNLTYTLQNENWVVLEY